MSTQKKRPQRTQRKKIGAHKELLIKSTIFFSALSVFSVVKYSFSVLFTFRLDNSSRSSNMIKKESIWLRLDCEESEERIGLFIG